MPLGVITTPMLPQSDEFQKPMPRSRIINASREMLDECKVIWEAAKIGRLLEYKNLHTYRLVCKSVLPTMAFDTLYLYAYRIFLRHHKILFLGIGHHPLQNLFQHLCHRLMDKHWRENHDRIASKSKPLTVLAWLKLEVFLEKFAKAVVCLLFPAHRHCHHSPREAKVPELLFLSCVSYAPNWFSNPSVA